MSEFETTVYFGGSFDPVHNGHLQLARLAGEKLDCREVVLLPCYQPPHKLGLHASAAQRSDMLRAAIDDLDYSESQVRLVVDERESLRSGASYTIDTVKELRGEIGPEASLVFVIGWDSLQSIDTWHLWRELFLYTHLLVIPRPSYRFIQSDVVKTCFDQRTVPLGQLKKMPAGGIAILDVPQIDLSSTRVRERIKKGELSRCEVPESVKKLIERDKLYQ